MENYSQDFNDTLNEAMNVRIELESIMENAIQISQTIVDQYAEKINQASVMTTEPEIILQSIAADSTQEELLISNIIPTKTETDNETLPKPRTIRIYELARDLQMSNKELIKLIKDLGIKVNSHLNALDDIQLHLIRQAIDSGLRIKQGSQLFGTALISSQDINPAVSNVSGLDLIVNEKSNNENTADVSRNIRESRQIEEQSLQGMEFSISELKKAHPYIAIKTMYDNGYPIWEIAKILDRGQGEVSLILNLSKKKAAGI